MAGCATVEAGATPAEQASASLDDRNVARDVIVGAVWLAVGLAITGASYAARGGGSYVVAYGAIIIGAARIVRGLLRR